MNRTQVEQATSEVRGPVDVGAFFAVVRWGWYLTLAAFAWTVLV